MKINRMTEMVLCEIKEKVSKYCENQEYKVTDYEFIINLAQLLVDTKFNYCDFRFLENCFQYVSEKQREEKEVLNCA